jgi:hypothetical protein
MILLLMHPEYVLKGKGLNIQLEAVRCQRQVRCAVSSLEETFVNGWQHLDCVVPPRKASSELDPEPVFMKSEEIGSDFELFCLLAIEICGLIFCADNPKAVDRAPTTI